MEEHTPPPLPADTVMFTGSPCASQSTEDSSSACAAPVEKNLDQKPPPTAATTEVNPRAASEPIKRAEEEDHAR
jgi:hypothetical protein